MVCKASAGGFLERDIYNGIHRFAGTVQERGTTMGTVDQWRTLPEPGLRRLGASSFWKLAMSLRRLRAALASMAR